MMPQHRLVLERATPGAENDRGAAEQTWATAVEFWGWVQPMSIRELGDLTQAGAVVSDHKIYTHQDGIEEADRIRHEPADGRIYQIDRVVPQAGLQPFYRIDVHLVEAAT